MVCRNCRHFPCMKPCCKIDDEGCRDFISNVEAEIKENDKKVKEEQEIMEKEFWKEQERIREEEIIMNRLNRLEK